MSRTDKEPARCPSGHKCEYCYRPYGSDKRDWKNCRKMRTEKKEWETDE